MSILNMVQCFDVFCGKSRKVIWKKESGLKSKEKEEKEKKKDIYADWLSIACEFAVYESIFLNCLTDVGHVAVDFK